MKEIVNELRKTTVDLFPNRHDSRMIAGVISLTIFISVSELLLAHFFSILILPDNPRTTKEIMALGALFLILFSLLRLISFGKEHFKLNTFETSLNRNSGINQVSDSWKWATAMELTSLLTMTGKLLFISGLLFFFSPIFAISNLAIGLCIFQILSYRLRDQFKSQEEFRLKQLSKKPVANSEKVRTRIIAGEIGSLISSAGLIVLLGVLLLLYVEEEINAAKAFVLFIAIRMIGQIYSGFSSGLMRFARARVLSE